MSVSRFDWLCDYHSLPSPPPSLSLSLSCFAAPKKCLAYFEGPTAWPARPHSLRWWTFCGALLGNLLSFSLCVCVRGIGGWGRGLCHALIIWCHHIDIDIRILMSGHKNFKQLNDVSYLRFNFTYKPKVDPKKPRLGLRATLDMP